MPNALNERLRHTRSLLDEGRIDEAKTLIIDIEKAVNEIADEKKRAGWRVNVSNLLINVGYRLKETSMISRGVEYLENWKDDVSPDSLGNLYFSLANGYYHLAEIKSATSTGFHDSEEHRIARQYFRLSAKQIEQCNADEYWATALWINYGNLLGDNGRIIEALDLFDEALKQKPNMGEALGNKGTQLCQLANSLSVYRYPLLFEAEQLLQTALEQEDLTDGARTSFTNGIEIVKCELQSRDQQKHQILGGIQPADEFQRCLCEFSARSSLFLSPVSFVGKDRRPFFGDPMFILGVPFDEQDDMKLHRCISFLNEIKNDYVLGRFFLFQSQYQSSNIDAVKEGVGYFRTFDGALYDIYVQLLKSALKQAVTVLDKVAYFIYAYCEMTKPEPDVVSFRTIWGDVNGGKLQKAFKGYENKYLFALFTLARDLCKGGDWESLISDRNIVTHRFMILHESQIDDQTSGNIPHKSIEDFRSDTLFALKTARAATMYLMLFVDEHGLIWTRQNPEGCMSAIGSEELHQLLVSFLNAD